MEQRNMLLAFALSMVILIGWSVMFPKEKTAKHPATPTTASAPAASEAPTPPGSVQPAAPHAQAPAPTASTGALIDKPAFRISNDVLGLMLNDRGWIIDASLSRYRENLKPGSPQVTVLHVVPHQNRAAYANTGVLGLTASPFKLAKKQSTGDASTLVLESTLSDGRGWQRTLTLHKGSYEVDITDRIQGGAATQMYTQIVERSPDKKASRFTQHVGPIALVGDKLHEIKYEDLDKDGPQRFQAKGGWTGMMTHYFIASIIGNPAQKNEYYFKSDGHAYQSGIVYDGKAENGATVFSTHLFLGPKAISAMKPLHAGLERSVDFGWFAFIAKPLHSLLVWLHGYIPNYGWCIIVLVLMIKALFFYPTKKSYESMAGMRKLQPEMKRMRELYADDRQKLGQEMMALYKKNKVNPMGGCLPIAVQIPVFFSLYKVLLMSIEMRHAPFIFWIHDLSAQDPYYVLPVLMGISMFVQQKLNPQQADPMMAKMMQFLPLLFTMMFLFFPSGLVIYWVVNNVLSITQQYFVMRSQGVLTPAK